MFALLEHGGIAKTAAKAFSRQDCLSQPGIRRVYSDGTGQFEMMACLFAAAVHDYEHRGLSNDFLVKTCDERALRYNDNHVNENHHAAAAFLVLQRPECNFLSRAPSEDVRWLRTLVIDLVLATDMVSHGKLVKSFTEVLDASCVHSGAPSMSCDEADYLAPFEPTSSKDAVLLLQMALKCADMGHLTLDWCSHAKWVERLEQEFYAQGDKERSLNLPVSFLMDRNKPGASQTQEGFFDFVALPMFRSLVRATPSTEPVLQGVLSNYHAWQERAALREKDQAAPGTS
jgi:cAMP-specific phosphodiesterase 4/high affinity cAMP-specific and IBMX-insensitive 3',5'-cyclic phosphodiesterase 8